MNNKKIAFITCVNDENMYEESLRYIDSLNIPEGYQIEKIPVRGAKSITSGYNSAVKKTDAKYKVYLHQDVFILEKNFICEILEIFKDKKVGMIGAAGTEKLNQDAKWFESESVHACVYDNAYNGKITRCIKKFSSKPLILAQAIDGLIMITQNDIKWREDIFDGWHFYDISQSFEFIKAGFKIIIINKDIPWVLHDCGITWVNNNEEYEHYRNAFFKEYLE